MSRNTVSLDTGFLLRFNGFVDRVTEFIRTADSAVTLSISERASLRRDVDELRGHINTLFESRNSFDRENVRMVEVVKALNSALAALTVELDRLERGLDKIGAEMDRAHGRMRDIDLDLKDIKRDVEFITVDKKRFADRKWDVVKVILKVIAALLAAGVLALYTDWVQRKTMEAAPPAKGPPYGGSPDP